MRFQRLDLIRYGKFTDKAVEMPRSPRDFHFIVGPNEAGKSTLRDAIQELFWGIHPRSPLDFVHPKNELRLGGKIEHNGQVLEFQRSKSRQSLRDSKDMALPDTALAAFLGSTDPKFFEKMFSLDHTRLVEGGKSILDSADDAGQVLFQASAGIASLGAVRDDLQKQAEALWTPRKAGERAYYKAAEQVEKASATLRSVMVRSKDWAEANGLVETLTARLEEERRLHEDLTKQRSVLNRVRFLAPRLQELRDSEAALAGLTGAVDLPAEAMAVLDSAEQELSRAQEVLKFRTTEVERLESALKALVLDETILPLGADIEALDAKRLKYIDVPRDIERRTIEVNMAWETAQAAMSQLNWSESDENSVRQRIPSLDKRKALDKLVKSHGRLEEAARSMRRAAEAKHRDIESIEKQLAELPETSIPVALTKAQSTAVQLGDVEGTRRRFIRDMASAAAIRAAAFVRLDPWQVNSDELRNMSLPEAGSIESKIREKQELLAELKQVEVRQRDQSIKVEKARLAVRQYQDTHHPVTREDVVAARAARDSAWGQVKDGRLTAAAGAAAVDAGIAQADEMADARLGKVEQETGFHNRRHLLEEAELEHEQLTTHVTEIEKKLAFLAADWMKQANTAKLNNMTLENMVAWLAHRDAALAAEDAKEKLKTDLAQYEERTSAVASDLASALTLAGATRSETTDLATLTLEALAFTGAAEAARGTRDALKSQLASGKTDYGSLEQQAGEAEDELAKWQAAWVAALHRMGLDEKSGLTEGETALELIDTIETQIESMREKRVNRIEAMKTDLKTFDLEFERVARQVDTNLLKQDAASATIALVRRLTAARDIQRERLRLSTELQGAQQTLKNAEESIGGAKARIEPMHVRAGTTTVEALRDAIRESDHRRQFSADVIRLGRNLVEHGEGFKREAIEEEIDAADLAQIPADLAGVDSRLSDSVKTQSQLSANLANAHAALEKIAGSNAGAQAESERQSGIASMAYATERFIQVATSHTLLRWAIDRYREKNQDPLLARASAIFAGLTQGSFQKLHMDYEQEPPALEGVRSNGRVVGILGLSDGTRDQLYLALRLAALELHLDRAHVMPFVADDLFINFDDDRSEAGLQALAELSERTQVVFLSHHDHLTDRVRKVFGETVNVVALLPLD